MVLIDATWPLPIWPAVQKWRDQGGKVAFVIYDILQITQALPGSVANILMAVLLFVVLGRAGARA